MGSPLTILNPTPLTKLHSRTTTHLHGKLDTWLHPIGLTDITITLSVQMMEVLLPKFVHPGGEWPDFMLVMHGLLSTALPTTDGEVNDYSVNDMYGDHAGPWRALNRWFPWIQLVIDGRTIDVSPPWPAYLVVTSFGGLQGWRPRTMSSYTFSNGRPVSGPYNPADGFGYRISMDYANARLEVKIRSYKFEALNIQMQQGYMPGRETPVIPYHCDFTDVGGGNTLAGDTFTLGNVPTGGYDPLGAGSTYDCEERNTPVGRAVCAGHAVRRTNAIGDVTHEGWAAAHESLSIRGGQADRRPWYGFLNSFTLYAPPGFPQGEHFSDFEGVYAQVEEVFVNSTTVQKPMRLRCEIEYNYQEPGGGEYGYFHKIYDKTIPHSLAYKRYEAESLMAYASGAKDEGSYKVTEALVTFGGADFDLTAQITPFSFTVDTNGEEV